MNLYVRRPGADDSWSEEIPWPQWLRIPIAGEMLDLPEHGPVTVTGVMFHADAESVGDGGEPAVQVWVTE